MHRATSIGMKGTDGLYTSSKLSSFQLLFFVMSVLGLCIMREQW